MTLNNVLDLLKKFADDHRQINDFEKGPTDDFNTKQTKYPAMWVALNPSTYSGNAVNYRFSVILYDLIFSDNSNETEVQSDMLLVGMDLIAHLKNNPDYDFTISGDPSIEYFTEDRGTDLTAGVVIGLTLKDPRPLDNCAIPFL